MSTLNFRISAAARSQVPKALLDRLAAAEQAAKRTTPKLIFGLWNHNTHLLQRHNVGALVLDHIARASGVPFKRPTARASFEVAKIPPAGVAMALASARKLLEIGSLGTPQRPGVNLESAASSSSSSMGRSQSIFSLPTGSISPGEVILVRNVSFMNTCGPSFRNAMKIFNVSDRECVIVQDDLDIAFSVLSVKQGSARGHNGIRSIVEATGMKDLLRLGIGIGRPPANARVADFVLRNFTPTEASTLMKQSIPQATITLLEEGFLWHQAADEELKAARKAVSEAVGRMRRERRKKATEAAEAAEAAAVALASTEQIAASGGTVPEGQDLAAEQESPNQLTGQITPPSIAAGA
ncbi:hypothetical protein H696_04653 [Fonticula alba]|uniref:peptidyl-tRNA hydrolase n=1 Tax=Fonticula alba TaxID=691883 RepID=A0A058Z525_FONAL|nr:hypothetical protein H696_04653 [Fonticula alba]KCV69236.1 hypothetical protein H696_04653 [Fonticula alba]|eukprot:XP_009496807.1 hypothetical protein H696_04653 [Fonticula alba]